MVARRALMGAETREPDVVLAFGAWPVSELAYLLFALAVGVCLGAAVFSWMNGE